jgi:hypothetical protein
MAIMAGMDYVGVSVGRLRQSSHRRDVFCSVRSAHWAYSRAALASEQVPEIRG